MWTSLAEEAGDGSCDGVGTTQQYITVVLSPPFPQPFTQFYRVKSYLNLMQKRESWGEIYRYTLRVRQIAEQWEPIFEMASANPDHSLVGNIWTLDPCAVRMKGWTLMLEILFNFLTESLVCSFFTAPMGRLWRFSFRNWYFITAIVSWTGVLQPGP